MKIRPSRKPYLYGSITVILVMLVGWLVGQVLATSDNTYMRILLLQDVVTQVTLRYVDEIPQDQLYQRAVNGLLKNLDPYTELIPADEFNRFQELQIKSEYLGTGISISRVNGGIVVMSIFPGSSAWRQGVQPGDRIIRVNGESTKGWSTEQAKTNLLGPENTDVEIAVSRVGVPEPVELTLTRMPVVVPTVTRHFMLDSGVGYLRLSNFTERSVEELKQHLEQLQDQGMSSLILDLRDNAGGLTEPAIGICDLFLKKRQLIVSMRGRNPEDNKSFFSTGKPVFADQPLVMLINEFSASSSEIVAGAFQDHDRAVIVGTNSFGKGLVQTTFPLSTGDVLKITTARYYTPSGRNIQREVYRRPRFRFRDEEDQDDKDKKEERFLTDMGREVQGGGGITPDVIVAADSAFSEPMIAKIFPHAFDFAVAYKSMHPGLEKPFQAGSDTYKAFIDYLDSKQVKLDKEKISKYRRHIMDYLLTYQIAQVTWDESTAYQLISLSDKQLTRALSIVNSGRTQAEIIRKNIQEQSN